MIIKKVILLDAPEPPFIGTRISLLVTEEAKVFGIASGALASGSESITIDWGDGTVETVAAIRQATHPYEEMGEHEVRISDDVNTLCISTISAGSPFREKYPKLIRRIVSNAQKLTATQFGCFIRCTNMTSFDLGDSAITSLKYQAFMECTSLTTYRLPKGLVSLGAQAFRGCSSLRSVDYPSGVAYLNAQTFQNCTSLSGEVFLPSVVYASGTATTMPFAGCTGLTKIHFAAANEETVKSGSAYQTDPTLGTGAGVCVFDL